MTSRKPIPTTVTHTRARPLTPCTPPADPGSAAVVAHASESSSGAGIPPTLEQFQRWLENKAHAAHAHYWNGPDGETLSQEINRCKPYTLLISECRVATSLLMQFKLEQGA